MTLSTTILVPLLLAAPPGAAASGASAGAAGDARARPAGAAGDARTPGSAAAPRPVDRGDFRARPPKTVGHRLPGGSPLRAGQPITAPREQGVSVLTRGHCLLRLSPGARLRLKRPAPGTRCAAVTLLAGRLSIVTPRGEGPALHLRLGRHRLIWHGGEGSARHSRGVRGICLRRGRVSLASGAVAPRSDTTPAGGGDAPGGKSTPGGGFAPGRGGTAAGKDAAPEHGARPGGIPPGRRRGASPGSVGAGRCLWIGDGGGLTVSKRSAGAERRRPSGAPYAFHTSVPRLSLDLDAEVASLRARVLGDAAGGSDVEGGGQSMCLETGSEGSAADLGGSAVDITKPPPPTRLRLRIRIRRGQP